MTTPRILDRIQAPCDIKELDARDLTQLAREIREELVSTVAATGGHLAPNLGVVELTLGIHRALDCPKDRIIFDVGHQSYVHKLLTGRLADFPTLRQYGGLSGFPKRSESAYDAFDTGHASDSISVALGLALARDAAGTDENIVAVIGDGSISGGMAFEALNHIGHLEERIIVVLNDNEMSISKNVGGLARYLGRARLDPHYRRLRDGVEHGLASMPFGKAMVDAGERVKDSIKHLVVPGMLFEELGLNYVGPIDGHDVAAVQSAMESAKQFAGPVIIHAVTRKGQGYPHAEDNPDAFHGIGPFSVDTGKASGGGSKSYTQVFAESLIAEAERDEHVVGITAAMPSGTGLDAFAERFPERFFDVGIAEEHAVGLAAGLALGGRRPVVAIYSTFLQRAYDQIIIDVALQDLPVVFCIDRAGLVGEDGATHHGVFDLAYLRAVPNLAVLAPSNESELAEALHTALSYGHPIAIRYPRGAGEGAVAPSEPTTWHVGESVTRRSGAHVALLAVGRMVGVARGAAELLAASGIEASLIDMRWVKPLDSMAIERAARDHLLIVTLEEGTECGGFGSAVLEAMAAAGLATPTERVAVPDRFVTHGAMSLLLEEIGLTASAVANRISAHPALAGHASSGVSAG